MSRNADKNGWTFSTKECEGLPRARAPHRFAPLYLRGRTAANQRELLGYIQFEVKSKAADYFRACKLGVVKPRLNRKVNWLAGMEAQLLSLRQQLSAQGGNFVDSATMDSLCAPSRTQPEFAAHAM